MLNAPLVGKLHARMDVVYTAGGCKTANRHVITSQLLSEIQIYVVTRDPNRKCAGGEVGIREHGLSGALSIGRFVVSRWHVCGGRGPMGIQSSVGVLCVAEIRNWGRNGRSQYTRQA